MSTKVWLVVVDSESGETFHIDEADADVHVEHTAARDRVTVHVRRKGAGGEWPPGSDTVEIAGVAVQRARLERLIARAARGPRDAGLLEWRGQEDSIRRILDLCGREEEPLPAEPEEPTRRARLGDPKDYTPTVFPKVRRYSAWRVGEAPEAVEVEAETYCEAQRLAGVRLHGDGELIVSLLPA